MSYVDKSLMPNEQVTFRTRLHPIVFRWSILFALICALLIASQEHESGAIGLFFLLAIAFGLLEYLAFATSEFAVTSKRVIIKVGVLRRRTLELQLSKLEAVAVNHGILGRLLGYGNIVVTGTGGTKEPFKNIRYPREARKYIWSSKASALSGHP
jgi:uncharacterized membrane protein YdbT with pleckstrin-like domain